MTTNELANALQINFDGKPWHGSSLVRIINNVAPEHALVRPAPEIRSIAELLAHTVAWMEITTERLRGEDPRVTPERDFPAASDWSAVVARMHRSFATLIETIRSNTDEAFWNDSAPGRPTMRYMVEGLLQHNTDHAAQIALQNRMMKARP